MNTQPIKTALTRLTDQARRITHLLKVSVQENDPTLKATQTAFGFKVSGTASNNGITASRLKLGFDGKSVSLPLSEGDTGASVLRKLRAALPKGYEAHVIGRLGSSRTIGISKAPGTGGTPSIDPAKIPTSISANNASAQVESEIWVDSKPGPGPGAKNANATVRVSGVGFADAPPTFQVKSIDVYEQGTNKKVATVANPTLENSEVRRGQKTQSYSLQIPLVSLDLSKTYTFVANTGINGSTPQKVRSEYVTVGQAF
ncbi:MAG: hypothetical protein IPJ65_29555 [Archangiaceae bacterium]|nr:hypothetical protein [Archangiaceae bacterium]